VSDLELLAALEKAQGEGATHIYDLPIDIYGIVTDGTRPVTDAILAVKARIAADAK
jgi:hypothetical protein